MASNYTGSVRYVYNHESAAKLVGYAKGLIGIFEGMEGNAYRHTDPSGNFYNIQRNKPGGDITCHIDVVIEIEDEENTEDEGDTIIGSICISRIDQLVNFIEENEEERLCTYYRCGYSETYYNCTANAPNDDTSAEATCYRSNQYYDPYFDPTVVNSNLTGEYLKFNTEEFEIIVDQNKIRYFDLHAVKGIDAMFYTFENLNLDDVYYTPYNVGIGAPSVNTDDNGHSLIQYRMVGYNYNSIPIDQPYDVEQVSIRKANCNHVHRVTGSFFGGYSGPNYLSDQNNYTNYFRHAFIDKYPIFRKYFEYKSSSSGSGYGSGSSSGSSSGTIILREAVPNTDDMGNVLIAPFLYNYINGSNTNVLVRWVNILVESKEIALYQITLNIYPNDNIDTMLNFIDETDIELVHKIPMVDIGWNYIGSNVPSSVWYYDNSIPKRHPSYYISRRFPDCTVNKTGGSRGWIKPDSGGKVGYVCIKAYYSTSNTSIGIYEPELSTQSDWDNPGDGGLWNTINVFDINIEDDSFTINNRYEDFRTVNSMHVYGLKTSGKLPFNHIVFNSTRDDGSSLTGGYGEIFRAAYESPDCDPNWYESYNESYDLSNNFTISRTQSLPAFNHSMVVAVVPDTDKLPISIINNVTLDDPYNYTGSNITYRHSDEFVKTGELNIDGSNTIDTYRLTKTNVVALTESICKGSASTLIGGFDLQSSFAFSCSHKLTDVNLLQQGVDPNDPGNILTDTDILRTQTWTNFQGNGNSVIYEDLENGIFILENCILNLSSTLNRSQDFSGEVGKEDVEYYIDVVITIELIVFNNDASTTINTRSFRLDKWIIDEYVDIGYGEFETSLFSTSALYSNWYNYSFADVKTDANHQSEVVNGTCNRYFGPYIMKDMSYELVDGGEFPQRLIPFRFSQLVYRSLTSDEQLLYNNKSYEDQVAYLKDQRTVQGLMNVLGAPFNHQFADEGHVAYASSWQFTDILKSASINGDSLIRLRTNKTSLWGDTYEAEDIVLLNGVRRDSLGEEDINLPPAKDIVNIFVT